MQNQLREKVLENPERHTVNFSFSLHAMRMVENGMQVHLVLKFRYSADIIESVMGTKKPDEDYKHEFGTPTRIFPYCIFNSVEEAPISWTYQNTNGNVYERIELSTTITYVSYTKYFPFVLRLLPVKIGSDGTGKTGLINLVPETLEGGSVPNADLGVFTKSTSEFSIGGDDDETISAKVVCRMFVRDLSDKAIGNIAGIYTRVYLVIFFEARYLVNILRYIVVPTLIMQLCTFFTMMEIGDLVQTVLAMTLADVALLFVMPEHDEVTTAEELILLQICYFITCGCVVGALKDHDMLSGHPQMGHEILALDLSIAGATIIWTIRGFFGFRMLANNIRRKFDPMISGYNVGSFKLVDQEI